MTDIDVQLPAISRVIFQSFFFVVDVICYQQYKRSRADE